MTSRFIALLTSIWLTVVPFSLQAATGWNITYLCMSTDALKSSLEAVYNNKDTSEADRQVKAGNCYFNDGAPLVSLLATDPGLRQIEYMKTKTKELIIWEWSGEINGTDIKFYFAEVVKSA